MTSILQDSRTKETTSLKNAILTSQPLSGGLWSLTHFPQVTQEELKTFQTFSYQQLAFSILSRFDLGVTQEELLQIIDDSYGSQWHHADITPVHKLEDLEIYSLHLGYGPTLAFKNIALEFLPRLLSVQFKGEIVHVFGASSGDTINAAHSGVRGTNIRSLFMLPDNGPSQVQKLQALEGIVDNPNAFTLLSQSPFDPLQDIIKKVNSLQYKDFKEAFHITSFNSINIARILAQVVYYFRAYSQIGKIGKLKEGEEVIFNVPSGNFGDALAGYYAKKMGLPIAKIIIATNENDMLHQFFQTGVYKSPKREGKDFVQLTNAPSMDIAKASNFERMLFDMYHGDSEKIAKLYQDFATHGSFVVEKEILEQMRSVFDSHASTNEERLHTIRLMDSLHHWGIDPHTASGVVPMVEGDLIVNPFGKKVIFLETSHIAQFGTELSQAGIDLPQSHHFDDLLASLRKKQPQEGRDFCRINDDFSTTLATIEKIMKEVLPKK